MNRQSENFTTLLAKWPETASQEILNRKTDIPTLTILYERLSHDDEFAVGESNSIKNQKAMLESFAVKNDFPNIIHLTDDGVSGTRFDRPDFIKAMELVEAGCVSIFAVKDLSRFGRDHLRVGLYTERLRECGVRFIAVQDNVDTLQGEDDFTPFRNIINEWAARDASRKVKAVFKAKGMEGKPLNVHCLYGFKRDPQDKNRWLIDEPAAAIVRRIFQMTVDGMGPFQIAHRFADEKIERPSYYHGKQGRGNLKNTYDSENPYSWRGNSIAEILKKPEYKGCLANFKTFKTSYKDKNRKPNPKEAWELFEGAVPQIVDTETWELAQKLRTTKRRTDSLGEANPLTGLMFCADCGQKMWNHRIPDPKPQKHANGRMYKRAPVDFYDCSTFKRNEARYVSKCSRHYIMTRVVRELVLDSISQVSRFVKYNEEDFVRLVREESQIQQEATAKAWKKQLAKNEKRIAELDNIIRLLFEDKAKGALTEKRFEVLSSGYETEQETLERQCAELREEIERYVADSVRVDKFVELVSRYKDFTELTPQMLNEFIEKIVVYEADKSTGERHQDVDIHLSFIGKFKVPQEHDGLTDAEREAQAALEEKRAKQRIANRKCYAKNRSKAAREKQAGKTAPVQKEITA